VSAIGGALVFAPRPGSAAPLPHPRGGRLGLELYSLRSELKKDPAAALRTARAWGFEEVELVPLDH